jgi:hypothetical protein
MPQQALALANSELALNQAQVLATKLLAQSSDDSEKFITLAFAQILARSPKAEEARVCREFLANPTKVVSAEKVPPAIRVSVASARIDGKRARDLILVLFNHNDFISIR